jgi:hypothetical protein
VSSGSAVSIAALLDPSTSHSSPRESSSQPSLALKSPPVNSRSRLQARAVAGVEVIVSIAFQLCASNFKITNKPWHLNGLSCRFPIMLLLCALFVPRGFFSGRVFLPKGCHAVVLQAHHPDTSLVTVPAAAITKRQSPISGNVFENIMLRQNLHGSSTSVSHLQPLEIGDTAILIHVAYGPELARHPLGSRRPEVAGHAPLPYRDDRAANDIDHQPFRMCTASIAHLILGVIVALGRSFLLKMRSSPALHRSREAIKYSQVQKTYQPDRNYRFCFLWIFNLFSRPALLLLIAILPSVAQSQTPPITSGLIAHYNADSWTGSRWTDLSGAGNHVTDIGGTTNISVARPVGAPAYIYGAPTAWMKFPAGILPSAEYTLFYVARYNGAVRRRIFQGVDTNWLSGFWEGRSGTAHHGSCFWMTDTVDRHGSDWVLGTDRSNSFRSNGEDRTITSACSVFDRLAINAGALSGETSDFAVQSVLVYNRRLADADVQKLEAWLTSLQPAFTPATLQASVYLLNLNFCRINLVNLSFISRILNTLFVEFLTCSCRASSRTTTPTRGRAQTGQTCQAPATT